MTYYGRWIETPNAITISYPSDDGGCTRAHERHPRRDVIERRPERGRYPEPHGRFLYPLSFSPAFACGISQPGPPALRILFRASSPFSRPHRQLQSWSLSEPWSQPIRTWTVSFLSGPKRPSPPCSGRDPARRSYEWRSTTAADGSNGGFARKHPSDQRISRVTWVGNGSNLAPLYTDHVRVSLWTRSPAAIVSGSLRHSQPDG